MSSIQGIGQGFFQYIQSAKEAAAHDPNLTQAADETNEDAEGGSGPYLRNQNEGPFGKALILTLQKYGIDPDKFQRDFLAALRSVSGVENVSASKPVVHLNAVG